MMTPNQIKMQNFSPAGRGTYKSIEVDSFMQRVYASYTELYSENAELKKKFASLKDIIEEYNASKNAIATAFVKAQAVADQTLESAKSTADELVSDAEKKAKSLADEKIKEADSYAEEKKRTADEYFEKAQKELQEIMENAKAESEKYVEEINEKAKQIIEDANSKAAKIVSDAYGDAKLAQDKKNEIIADAKKQLVSVRNEITKFKDDSLGIIRFILPKLESLSVPDFDFEADLSNEETVAFEPVDETVATPEVQEEIPAFKAPEPKKELPEIKEEKKTNSDSATKAYIPDADEYVKRIFDEIDLGTASSEKATEEKKDTTKNDDLGYNGNKTSFSVSEDFDLFDDDDE